MNRETHRVTAYAAGHVTQTATELSADRLFFYDHDWRGVFTVAGQYCGDCVVDAGVLRPKSAERTAGPVVRIPQETGAGPVECVGEYDLVVYVPDTRSDGLYLATPNPAGSDYRGVIAHRPSESVYEMAGLPPSGTDPVFDVMLATTGDSAPADVRTYRNVETDARGGITGSRYEGLRDTGALRDVVPVVPMSDGSERASEPPW